MISKAFKKKIVATLGKRFSPKIIAKLNDLGYKNAKGEPYSPASIQSIVSGAKGRENLEVEAVIIDLVSFMQKHRTKQKVKTSNIIKTK